MNKFLSRALNFLKSEDGPTATEYAVMVALIAVVVITGATMIGTSADAKFQEVSGAIDGL
ncbi:MAG TPA: Flp family type IVb pilin [Phycisphaerae bacterium]|nr:Flp family type IVb pilin [Phycisphaerae bacterium]HNU43768.1 Flp family type IVb pilin [Phycisphaerae bacterium]